VNDPVEHPDALPQLVGHIVVFRCAEGYGHSVTPPWHEEIIPIAEAVRLVVIHPQLLDRCYAVRWNGQNSGEDIRFYPCDAHPLTDDVRAAVEAIAGLRRRGN
jgi:hypothetical protein